VNVFQEIHDRSLWQVFGLYLASSWVVLQVVDTLDSVIGLPGWVPQAAIILLLLGLPIVMVTAFVQRGWRRSDPGKGGEATAASSGPAEPRGGLFTWRNALLGGLGAFALLGVGTALWIGMRVTGIGPAGTLVAKGVLEERGVVVLADFDNSTDDPTLSDVVTEALRVDLSQSEALVLADPGFIGAALGRMERDPETPLEEGVAFEIARREGVRAVVTGDVARAGAGYVLSASLVAPEDGGILLSHREGARDETELLDAIDALSRHMRERVGDPLKSIADTPPLAQVTTSNLDALRKYTESLRLPEAEFQRRIALMEDAVAADSTFAMAWSALATQLSNYGVEPGRALEARARSFQYRENLPTRELNFVSAMYYLSGTNQPRQAIPYLEAIIEQDPAASGPINNLGEAYRKLGDLDRAISAIPFINLAQVHTTRGDREAALEAADYLETYAGSPFPDWHRAMALGGTGDYRAAEVAARRALEGLEGRSFLLAQGMQWLGALAAIQGRLEEGVEYWRRTADIQEENGSDVEALRNRIFAELLLGSAYRSDDVSALDAVIEASPLGEMDPVVRPLLEGQPLEAVEKFRLAASRPQNLHPMAGLARAFDAAGQADSALVHYRRFLEAPHWLSIVPHVRFLPDALQRAAELEYEAGNLREAAAHLARFVELWEDADEALQPRVLAAQARLQEIVDEIG
jgi:tetratricopeptide (TPR) repeat protein/TolB-like protein